MIVRAMATLTSLSEESAIPERKQLSGADKQYLSTKASRPISILKKAFEQTKQL